MSVSTALVTSIDATERVGFETVRNNERKNIDTGVSPVFAFKQPYWGYHFWARGYCVDTVGIDEDIIRKYVKFQEKEETGQDGLF